MVPSKERKNNQRHNIQYTNMSWVSQKMWNKLTQTRCLFCKWTDNAVWPILSQEKPWMILIDDWKFQISCWRWAGKALNTPYDVKSNWPPLILTLSNQGPIQKTFGRPRTILTEQILCFFLRRWRSTLSWSRWPEGSAGSWRAAPPTTWRPWRRASGSSLACWRTRTQSLQGYDATAANAKRH